MLMPGMRGGSISELRNAARKHKQTISGDRTELTRSDRFRKLYRGWLGSSSLSYCDVNADAGGSLIGSIGRGTTWGVMGTSTGVASCSGWGSGSDMVMGYICAGGACAGVLLPDIRGHKCSMAASSSGGALLAPWIVVAKCCAALTIRSTGETVCVLIA